MANIEQFKIPEMSAYDKKDAEEYWSEYEAFEDEEKSKGSDVEVSRETQRKIERIKGKKLFSLVELMQETA